MISKKATGKNAVQSISNKKKKKKSIRILPSNKMMGQNILIEKSKFEMASEDIATMHRLIKES